MMELYKTIDGAAEAVYEEKKSQFIANLSFVDTEQKALEALEAVRARHRTASHHVYAYLLREGARVRYTDDGEPAKTAGMPTLEVLRHAQLTDCILVTTRYFGGTLLGTGGLVRAYTAAAQMAVVAAHTVTMRCCVRGELQVAYSLYEQAARLLQAQGARLGDAVFGGEVTLPFVLLTEQKASLEQALQALCRGQEKVRFSAEAYEAF